MAVGYPNGNISVSLCTICETNLLLAGRYTVYRLISLSWLPGGWLMSKSALRNGEPHHQLKRSLRAGRSEQLPLGPRGLV